MLSSRATSPAYIGQTPLRDSSLRSNNRARGYGGLAGVGSDWTPLSPFHGSSASPARAHHHLVSADSCWLGSNLPWGWVRKSPADKDGSAHRTESLISVTSTKRKIGTQDGDDQADSIFPGQSERCLRRALGSTEAWRIYRFSSYLRFQGRREVHRLGRVHNGQASRTCQG